MKKKTLSNKEKRKLNEEIEKYGMQFEKRDLVDFIEYDKFNVIKSNKEIMFFYFDEEICPSVKSVLLGKTKMKKVVVDMGAVKFVVNGADIMRPGIVEIDEGIAAGDVIQIVDVNNKKTLSIGKAMFDSGGMKNTDSGKVVKNLHFVGDEIWNS